MELNTFFLNIKKANVPTLVMCSLFLLESELSVGSKWLIPSVVKKFNNITWRHGIRFFLN